MPVSSVNLSLLESLVTETRHQFILAKADGILDAGEVIAIAVGIASKIQRLGPLSGPEKKAVVMMALKRGLEAAGGVGSLPGLTESSSAEKEALEQQLLAAAAAALDMAVAVASGKIDLRKPSSWKSCLPFCSAALSAAAAFVPKDQAIVREALSQAATFSAAAEKAESLTDLVPAVMDAAASAAAAAGEGQVASAIAAIEEIAAPALAAVAAAAEAAPAQEESAPPATESPSEPSPAASAEAAPAPSGEVKFE